MSCPRLIVAVALMFACLVQTHASATPKTAGNPCGVRGTWNAATKTCTCKEGWDPKYNCDFGLNPLGDLTWQEQFQAMANPKNFKVNFPLLATRCLRMVCSCRHFDSQSIPSKILS